jgi:folate-binding Fe-S cluster repair protein YgfZ
MIRSNLRSLGIRHSRFSSTTATESGSGYYFTKLTNRSLLGLTGKDSVKFLQGLISNDLTKLDNLIYAGLLKADVNLAHLN